MATIGRIWVPELNDYVDVFDAPGSIPDDYVGRHAAVPSNTVRSEEQVANGVGMIREPTSTGFLAHPTYVVGAPPLLLILGLVAIIMASAALIILSIVAMTTDIECVDANPDGSCNMYVVRQGLAAPHYYDPTTKEWGSLGDGLGSVVQNLALILVVGAGLFVGIKYIMPELPKAYQSIKKAIK